MTISGLRAIAQGIAEDCDAQVDELGPAAYEAVLTRATARAVIAVIDIHDTWPANVTAAALPPRIKRALDDYAANGLRTGDCLYAVLTNDLRLAFARADAEVSRAMPAILTYITSNLPASSWGTVELVEAWIRRPRS